MKFKYIIFFLTICGSLATAQTKNPVQKANEAFKQGDFARAVEIYVQVLKDKQSAPLFVNLAHAYARLKQWPAAVKAYKDALALKDPQIKTSEIYGYLGQAEYMRHNYIQALHYLARARQDESPGKFSLLIARCLIDLQRFHLAEDEVMEFLKLNPDDIQAGEMLAHIYMQTDQPAYAADIYQGLLSQKPLEIRYFKALAQALLAAGRDDKAIDTLEMARHITGPNTEDLDRLLADLYIKQNMPREAASCYSHIIHNLARPNPEDVYRLGYCYYQSHQWLSARQAFNRVLQLDPSHAHAALYLGHIASQKGDIDAACQAYLRAAKIDKQWPEPYLSLVAQQIKQKNFQQAAEYFQKALTRKDFGSDEYYRYLLTLQQAGNKDQFKKILVQALSKYPQDNRWHRLLDPFVSESPD